MLSVGTPLFSVGPWFEPFLDLAADAGCTFEQSQAIAETLPPGSLQERFYRSLQRAAEDSINWSRESDGQLRDGRSW